MVVVIGNKKYYSKQKFVYLFRIVEYQLFK